ncbi:hypothetical protein [Glycomyces paridis]|uniref:Uncharacterized protein n=1 Tax=Glycomyces paridis TaxID=2126555 RepID=A0A4S8PC96_9ACTN|nr:hypothetical protein [Glycomyces paridis]THV27943.1 hypothetical protein E9998_13210 [Glycomyces paridis]
MSETHNSDALMTAEDIEAFDDIEYDDIPVPEWGGRKVRIRGLSGEDWAHLTGAALVATGRDVSIRVNIIAEQKIRVVAACLVGPDMEPLFTRDKIRVLGKKSAAAIERLYDKAQELSGQGEDAVEAAEGNSGAGPTGSTS